MSFLNNVNTGNDLIYVLIRTTVVYLYAILALRLGSKRFHNETPFDFTLVIIIGAILGRTIYGGASLIATLCSATLLIGLHWLFAVCSFHSHRFGVWVKGRSQILIQNGELDWKTLKQNQISYEDLLESFRERLHIDDFKQVQEARLERSGKISFLLKKPQ